MALRNPEDVFHKYDFTDTHVKIRAFMLKLLEDSGAFGEPAIDDAGQLLHFSPFPPLPTEQDFYALFPRITVPQYQPGHIGWFYIINGAIERFANNTAKMPLDIELHGCAAISRPNIATHGDLTSYRTGYSQSRQYILTTTRNVLKRLQDNDMRYRLYGALQSSLFAPDQVVAEYSWENLIFMWFYQSRLKIKIDMDLETRYSL